MLGLRSTRAGEKTEPWGQGRAAKSLRQPAKPRARTLLSHTPGAPGQVTKERGVAWSFQGGLEL